MQPAHAAGVGSLVEALFQPLDELGVEAPSMLLGGREELLPEVLRHSQKEPIGLVGHSPLSSADIDGVPAAAPRRGAMLAGISLRENPARTGGSSG